MAEACATLATAPCAGEGKADQSQETLPCMPADGTLPYMPAEMLFKSREADERQETVARTPADYFSFIVREAEKPQDTLPSTSADYFSFTAQEADAPQDQDTLPCTPSHFSFSARKAEALPDTLPCTASDFSFTAREADEPQGTMLLAPADFFGTREAAELQAPPPGRPTDTLLPEVVPAGVEAPEAEEPRESLSSEPAAAPPAMTTLEAARDWQAEAFDFQAARPGEWAGVPSAAPNPPDVHVDEANEPQEQPPEKPAAVPMPIMTVEAARALQAEAAQATPRKQQLSSTAATEQLVLIEDRGVGDHEGAVELHRRVAAHTGWEALLMGMTDALIGPMALLRRCRESVQTPAALEASKKRLRDRLELFGMEERWICGDGNCQFASVSDQLYGTPERHAEIRAKVAEALRRDKERYKSFLWPDPYEDFIEKVAVGGYWGDGVTLSVIADVFDVCIMLITSFDQDKFLIETQPDGKTSERVLWLAFLAEVHYSSVRLKVKAPPDCEGEAECAPKGDVAVPAPVAKDVPPACTIC